MAERARNGHLNRVKLLMVMARVECLVMAIVFKMEAVKLLMRKVSQQDCPKVLV